MRELENAIERAVVLASGLDDRGRAPADDGASERVAADPARRRFPGATMAEIERYAILETLKATGGSTSQAAEMLGISARTIQYRLHQYNEAPRSDVDVVRKDAASTAKP